MIIEAVLIPLAYLPNLLWKCLDIIIWILLAWSVAKLIDFEKKETGNGCVLFLLLQYPVWHMSVGMTVPVNYLWPLALGIFAFTLIRKYFNDEKIGWGYYVLCLLAAIFAANQEQMGIIVCAVFLVSFLLAWYQKRKIPLLFLPPFAIALAELMIALQCPGNKLRTSREIFKHLGLYKTFDTFDKLSMAWINTINTVFGEESIIFLLFFAVLAYYVWKKYSQKWIRGMALYPVCMSILYACNGVIASWYSNLENAFWMFQESESVTPDNVLDLSNYGCILTGTSVLLVTLWLCIILFDQWTEQVWIVTILAMGVGSRLVMGFSPTVYASNPRALIFLYFSIIIATLWIVKKKGIPNVKGIKVAAALLTLAAYLNNMTYIIQMYIYYKQK
jgi:hypothetical protein